LKRKIQFVVGAILMVALLWYLFRETDWAEVWAHLSGANKFWLAVSAAFVFSGFFLRALRWHFIVRSTKKVNYWLLYDATQIGFLANFTLPARAGEAIRALVLSRGAGIPFTKCVAFVALDRVTDLFGLMFVLTVTMLFFKPPESLDFPSWLPVPSGSESSFTPEAIQTAALSVVAVGPLIAIALLAIYLRPNWVLALSDAILGIVSKRFAETVHGWIEHFADGLHVFRSPVDMASSIFFSIGVWVTGALSIWAGLNAFSIEAPWYAGGFVLISLSIVIALPSTPGFVGPFHLGVMLGLVFVTSGITEDSAKAMAIYAHLVNLIPLCLTGIHSLRRQHVGLLQLEEEAEHLEEEAEAEAEAAPK